MNNWLNIIQNKLLPPRCIFCAEPGWGNFDLCLDCYHDLPVNRQSCRQCGLNLVSNNSNSYFCGQCLKQAPPFDQTYAPYLYQGGIRFLITQLKFHQDYKNARLLANLVMQFLPDSSEYPEALIPGPLHPNRYYQRGFNQSLEISRHLAKKSQVPLDLYSCIRIRDTEHQTGLTAKQRQTNLKQAFAIKKPLPYQHVAIIDDVITTGSTASAVAATLKNHGVQRVDVWACARA